MVCMHPSYLLRPALALLLSWLLACPSLPAQQTGNSGSQKPTAQAADSRAMVKPDPKRAKKLVEAGEKAEAAGAFPQALEAYEEAARYAPFDVNIVSKGAALRSRLIREYSRNAERMAIDGDLDGATEQLAAALHVDPSNGTVLERMKEMESMRTETQKQLPTNEEPPEGMAVVNPDKVTKSFHVQTDLRGAYEQVTAAFGIKASFDPDLPARNVKLRLDNVDFDTAMKVLGVETGTFWIALEPKLVFVAADSAEKRRQFDPVIEQTFMLPASTNSTEMAEVVRVVRELTGAQHIRQSANAHSLTIRDSVAHVQLAGEIIKDLERAPGEVILEIDLLEVDRNAASKLGITPPSSVKLYEVPYNLVGQLRSATSLTQILTILASVFGTTGATSLASAIPPIVAIGGGKSTFLLTLPSATADFSESLSLVQSGQQVLMRAEDRKPSTFFVGERYPITLSLLSASLGNSGVTQSVGGTGVSIASQQFPVGKGPVAMVTADFRTAGTNDLAVLNEIDNTLTILLNQATSSTNQFAQATNSPISLGTARAQAPTVPAALATGSLNSNIDAFPDLLVTDPVANSVTVLLENAAGDGTFTIQRNAIKVGNEPSAIAVGTFNTNTNSNIGFVVTNFADNTYSVFAGNADGTFTEVAGSPFALPTGDEGPYAITVADFNNDGIPDLAILNQTSSNVTILKGNGNGTFTQFPNSPLAVGKTPVAIASGDLAGSTGPALAIANQADNTVTVYLGNGDGTFAASSQSPLGTSAAPTGVAIAEVAQGSSSQAGGIAVTNRDTGTVTIFEDLGSGLFTKALEPAAGTNPEAILVGIFTGNSLPDIVVSNNLSDAAGTVTLLVTPTSLISNPANFQEPYPGSEYEDIGLKIKTTPSLHGNNEVTLQMDYEIKALAGSSFNGIPVIANRTLSQTVRLKEGETSIVAGLLDREETRTLTGLPGFTGLAGANYLLGSHNNSSQDRELLILITPRVMRVPVHDSRTIYAGRGEPRGRAGAGTVVAPTPQPEPERGPENPPPAQEQPQPENPAAAPPPPPPQPAPQQQPQQNPPEPQR
jgi:type II secretory pathway component GspD/PulD (secretin)